MPAVDAWRATEHIRQLLQLLRKDGIEPSRSADGCGAVILARGVERRLRSRAWCGHPITPVSTFRSSRSARLCFRKRVRAASLPSSLRQPRARGETPSELLELDPPAEAGSRREFRSGNIPGGSSGRPASSNAAPQNFLHGRLGNHRIVRSGEIDPFPSRPRLHKLRESSRTGCDGCVQCMYG